MTCRVRWAKEMQRWFLHVLHLIFELEVLIIPGQALMRSHSIPWWDKTRSFSKIRFASSSIASLLSDSRKGRREFPKKKHIPELEIILLILQCTPDDHRYEEVKHTWNPCKPAWKIRQKDVDLPIFFLEDVGGQNVWSAYGLTLGGAWFRMTFFCFLLFAILELTFLPFCALLRHQFWFRCRKWIGFSSLVETKFKEISGCSPAVVSSMDCIYSSSVAQLVTSPISTSQRVPPSEAYLFTNFPATIKASEQEIEKKNTRQKRQNESFRSSA